MGNCMRLQEGEQGSGGFKTVHGVAHRLSAQDFAVLTCMEHEYRSGSLVPLLSLISPIIQLADG